MILDLIKVYREGKSLKELEINLVKIRIKDIND